MKSLICQIVLHSSCLFLLYEDTLANMFVMMKKKISIVYLFCNGESFSIYWFCFNPIRKHTFNFMNYPMAKMQTQTLQYIQTSVYGRKSKYFQTRWILRDDFNYSDCESLCVWFCMFAGSKSFFICKIDWEMTNRVNKKLFAQIDKLSELLDKN